MSMVPESSHATVPSPNTLKKLGRKAVPDWGRAAALPLEDGG